MTQQAWREEGQDLVEYALVLPLFLFLVLGVIEFSVLFFQYHTVANAAREGARAGIVMPTELCDQTCLDAQVVTMAKTMTAGLDLTKLHIAVDHPAEDLITVVVTYDSGYITRAMAQTAGQGDFSVTLSSASTMRRER